MIVCDRKQWESLFSGEAHDAFIKNTQGFLSLPFCSKTTLYSEYPVVWGCYESTSPPDFAAYTDKRADTPIIEYNISVADRSDKVVISIGITPFHK